MVLCLIRRRWSDRGRAPPGGGAVMGLAQGGELERVLVPLPRPPSPSSLPWSELTTYERAPAPNCVTEVRC